MLSGRGLCDELITPPEESYRLYCVVVCDLETSRIGAPYIYDLSSLRVKPVVLASAIVVPVDSNRYPEILSLACRRITNTPENYLLNIFVSQQLQNTSATLRHDVTHDR